MLPNRMVQCEDWIETGKRVVYLSIIIVNKIQTIVQEKLPAGQVKTMLFTDNIIIWGGGIMKRKYR